jgi:hypothetical protein
MPFAAHWVWQPELWRCDLALPGVARVKSGTRFGAELALFHDSPTGAVRLRQIPNPTHGAKAAFCVRLDVDDFTGSFLSLAVDLPAAALLDLRQTHVIRVDAALQMDAPTVLFVRLNIKRGVNVEQRVRSVVPEAGVFAAAFDLFDGAADLQQAEKAWIDIIFAPPTEAALSVQDLQLSRFRRAEV